MPENKKPLDPTYQGAPKTVNCNSDNTEAILKNQAFYDSPVLFLSCRPDSCELLSKYEFPTSILPEINDFPKLEDKTIYFFNENKKILDQLKELLLPNVKALKVVEIPDNHETIAEFIRRCETNGGNVRTRIADALERAVFISIREPGEDEIKRLCLQVLSRQEARPFDTSELPPLIRNYINQLCETTNSDPIIITSSVYGMLSGMIGKRVYTRYFQRLYPNLWLLAVSASGTFKTTGLNKGAEIAYKMEGEVRDQIIELQKEIEKLEGSSKEIAKAEKRLNAEIKQLEAMSPVLPNRTTAEGLIESLSHGQAGTVFLSEFGDWLRTMEQSYNSGLKTTFTDLYDCPQQKSYKTKTDGTVSVRYPFISICGVSTIDWVQGNVKITDVSAGFFARFLLFYPPQKETIPPALPPIILNENSDLEKEIRSELAVLKETEFKLSASAAIYFTKLHNEIYKEISTHGETTRKILAPYLKRWSPYILKLAMINQVLIDPSKDISVEAIQGAYSLVKYAIESTTYLFQNDLGESEHQRKCRTVLEYIAKKGGIVTRHDLMSSRQLDGGFKEYDYILDSLIAAGRVDVDKAPKLKNNWRYLIDGEVEKVEKS
jgi:hypothetical protein